MELVKIAACDDQPEILDAFTHIVKGCFTDHDVPVSIRKFSNPIHLMKALETEYFDLLFLDIEMPQLNGIDLAKRLRKVGNKINIIYVSQKDDLVFDVFDVKPFSFIRKKRFVDDISNVIHSYVEEILHDDTHRLVISGGSNITTIDLNKTVYIEGAGKVQHAYMVGGISPVVIRSTMQELDDKLADKGFIRVQRGFLVNYKYIDSIRENTVTLTTGTSIPISRRLTQTVKDKYLGLIKWDNSAFC